MVIIHWNYDTDELTHQLYDGTPQDWIRENIIEAKQIANISTSVELCCEIQATPPTLKQYVVKIGSSYAFGKKGGILANIPGIRCEFETNEVFLFQGRDDVERDLTIQMIL